MTTQKIWRAFVLAGLLLYVLAMGAACAFDSKEGRFSVDFPVQPDHKEDGSSHSYSAEVSGHRFLVSYREGTGTSAERILDAAESGFARHPELKIVSRHAVPGDSPERCLVIQNPSHGTSLVCRIVVARDRAYFVLATCRGSQVDSVAQQFVDSFRVVGPDGIPPAATHTPPQSLAPADPTDVGAGASDGLAFRAGERFNYPTDNGTANGLYYKTVITVDSVTSSGVEYEILAGPPANLRASRTLRVEDLQSADTLNISYNSGGAGVRAGETSVVMSASSYWSLKKVGTATVNRYQAQSSMFDAVRKAPCTYRLVESVTVPLVVDGVQRTVTALRAEVTMPWGTGQALILDSPSFPLILDTSESHSYNGNPGRILLTSIWTADPILGEWKGTLSAPQRINNEPVPYNCVVTFLPNGEAITDWHVMFNGGKKKARWKCNNALEGTYELQDKFGTYIVTLSPGGGELRGNSAEHLKRKTVK